MDDFQVIGLSNWEEWIAFDMIRKCGRASLGRGKAEEFRFHVMFI